MTNLDAAVIAFGKALNNLIIALFDETYIAVNNIISYLEKCNENKPAKKRLPRKKKKQYKKLGIYDDWKNGKI